MTRELETARELMLRMPARWGINAGPQVLDKDDGISAQVLRGNQGEVWASASEANILTYVIRGEERHTQWYDGHEVFNGSIARGCFTVVPAGVAPRAVIRQPIEVLHIYLPHGDLWRRAAQMGSRQRPGGLELRDPRFASDSALESLCRCFLETLACGDAPNKLYRDCLVNALSARTLLLWSNAFDRGPQQRGGLAPWQVKRACEAMDSQLDGNVGLDTLAALLGVSPTHFSRAFKQSVGVPPFKWLFDRRMDRAKQLLRNASTPLAEVALAVGFSAQPQFTTAFRRAFGKTPGAWRREQGR